MSRGGFLFFFFFSWEVPEWWLFCREQRRQPSRAPETTVDPLEHRTLHTTCGPPSEVQCEAKDGTRGGSDEDTHDVTRSMSQGGKHRLVKATLKKDVLASL